jgi:hypothetical protein
MKVSEIKLRLEKHAAALNERQPKVVPKNMAKGPTARTSSQTAADLIKKTKTIDF